MKWSIQLAVLGLLISSSVHAQFQTKQPPPQGIAAPIEISPDPTPIPSSGPFVNSVTLTQGKGPRRVAASYDFGVPTIHSLSALEAQYAVLSCKLRKDRTDGTHYGAYVLFGPNLSSLSSVVNTSASRWLPDGRGFYNTCTWRFAWRGVQQHLIAGQVYTFRIVVINLADGGDPYFAAPILISDFHLQAPPMVQTEIFQAGSYTPMAILGQNLHFYAYVWTNFSMQSFGFTPRIEQPNDGIAGNLTPVVSEILWGGNQGDFYNRFGWSAPMNPYGWTNFTIYNPNNLTQILDYAEIRP